MALMDWAKTTARRHENHLSFGICCVLYQIFYCSRFTTAMWVIRAPDRIKNSCMGLHMQHYRDVTWAFRRLKSPATQLSVQQLFSKTRKTSPLRINGPLFGWLVVSPHKGHLCGKQSLVMTSSWNKYANLYMQNIVFVILRLSCNY